MRGLRFAYIRGYVNGTERNIMQEKIIEKKLIQAVKTMGGLAPKFVSPGFDGMPDRIVLMPGSKIGFIEVKRKGENPSPLQVSRHELLRRLGFKVYVLDDEGQIEQIIKMIGGDAEWSSYLTIISNM